MNQLFSERRPFAALALILIHLVVSYTAVHGPWHSTFLWPAIAIAVIELAGAVVGFVCFELSQNSGRATDA